MSEQLKATKFLLDKIKKLYPTFQYPDELDVELWSEILKGCSQIEILDALKAYRRDTEYNKAPNPAEFKRFLKAVTKDCGVKARILQCADELGDKCGKKVRDSYLKLARIQWPDVDLSGHEWTEPEVLAVEKNPQMDYGTRLMQRDIKLNRCRHLLAEYQAAVRYIAEDLLSHEMPVFEWRKMSYEDRCSAAMKKGLFNNFERALEQVCLTRNGKEYQFQTSAKPTTVNVSKAVNYLGAHYRSCD